MNQDVAHTAVRATLAVLERLAKRTRTPADDLLFQMLRANEGRLVDAVASLIAEPDQPPTDDRVAAALQHVGIRV
jgi:hypothetical protein